MTSKHLVNSLQSCVDECLEGLVAVNPGLQLLEGHRVVIRCDIEQVKADGKVTLLSGGGSGHEPTHAGFVGPGMLSGAIAGAIFTSPPPSSILAAIRKVGKNNPAGTLIIVKNYTGDRLNFGLAAERARAEGIKIDMVVVGEDCALTSMDKSAGRRGLAGVLFVHKIAGAMAEAGKCIEDIVQTVRSVIGRLGTIGLSLSPCSIPGSGASFQLEADEMELGLGIHGEAGVKRLKVCPAKEVVDIMLQHMTNPKSPTHLSLNEGDHVALMINNLGGSSVLEINIVAREAILWLEKIGVLVDRAYSGSFITALEMAGVSLTLLKLEDPTVIPALDGRTTAPGWCFPLLEYDGAPRRTPPTMPCDEEIVHEEITAGLTLPQEVGIGLHKILSFVCEALGNCEGQLNILDKEVGDGDCGTTFKRGTNAILQRLGSGDAPGLPVCSPSALALALAAITEEEMGGSSGALYSLFLSAAATPLAEDCSVKGWVSALDAGIMAIMRYGGANPGDRTMLDALYPALNALIEALKIPGPVITAFAAAAEAAEAGALATTNMAARAGRASYVASLKPTQPDPGAHAVGIWMRAAYQTYKLVLESQPHAFPPADSEEIIIM